MKTTTACTWTPVRTQLPATIFVTVAVGLLLIDLASVSAHELHPLRIHELDWPTDQVSRVLVNSVDIQSGAPIVAWSDPGRVQQIGDKSCLVGPYFMFDIDDNFAFNIDEPIVVEMLFDRAQTDGFILSYDHAAQPPVSQAVTFERGSKNRWHRQTVTLERAGFANRRIGSTDLSLAAIGAVMPYDGKSDQEIALCEISFKRPQKRLGMSEPQGTLKLEIREDSRGNLTPARVGIYGPAGRMPLPSDDAVIIRRFTDRVRQVPIKRNFEYWPEKGGYSFYVDGNYTAKLPAKTYRIVVVKGPEYRVVSHQFDVLPGRETKLSIDIPRWIDLPAAGWYSGDDHIHINRPRVADPSILTHMRAEDIHVANILQMGNLKRSYFSQYAFGQAGQHVGGDYALVSGQESPRTSHRGHTIGLNNSHFFRSDNYFVYRETADALHRDGGLFGYAHVMADALNASQGLAIDVPLGIVDFVEVLQHNKLGTEILYDFLNLGFKLTPTAGSDYPYLNNLPGSERTYVFVDGPFTPPAWYAALRQGRTFVSNAPVLEFDVAGRSMGDEVEVKSGDSVEVSAAVSINPDFDKPALLELVLHGEVVASAESGFGESRLQLKYEFIATESCWLAVRAYGEKGALAHSAPIFLLVDGRSNFWKRSAVPQLADKYQAKIQVLLNSLPVVQEDVERWDTGQIMVPAWQAQLPALREQARIASARYQTLAEQATVE